VSAVKIIDRQTYIDRLKSLRGTQDIKVITGVRRSGKSELMKSFINCLKEDDPTGNIIYVDLLDLENENLLEYHALYNYFSTRFEEGKNNYVLIDEVQLCKNFELAINSLYNKKKYDIYLTGSNAFMLSSDLATLFTGRFIEVHVFPFSFAEYLSFREEDDLNKTFEDYTRIGGMPGVYAYDSERDRRDYVSGIFNTIINRDLKQKYRLPDDTVLFKTADFLLDNICNPTSANNISNILSGQNIKTNHVTIGNYVKYLCDAYLFYGIKRYDIRGKSILNSFEKYYAVDSGFRYARLGKRNMDYGRQYENMVALELLRRGYTIYVGKLYQKEIDFVAMDGEKKIYIQVYDDISSEETREREFQPLLSIKDAYPKVVIARTNHPVYDFEGIKIIDLPRWLAGIESI